MNSKIDFVNGVEMNREHPETFHIPSVSEKTAAKPGQFVKVGVNFIPETKEDFHCERFWVIVSENLVDRQIIKGLINNDLLYTDRHGLACDQPIELPYDAILIIHG